MTHTAPRVMHVVLSLDVGGLERVVLDLVRRGRSSGRAVAVACLERPGHLAVEAERAGAEVFCMDKPPGRRPETVGRIRGSLARFRPDVVHTHQIGALHYAGPAARLEGIGAVVHTEHSDHAAQQARRFDRIQVRLRWGLAGRHARRFVGVSQGVVEAVAAFGVVPRRKLAVVPNGIDTAAFAPKGEGPREALGRLGVPGDAEVVGTVGRLAEVKRQDVLVRGFAQITATRPRARLVLVGDGPERAALGDLAGSLGVADRVHFAGHQERPERLVREMDVFAMTSRVEGMPLAVLEAWSAAVPVVATAVGGLAGLIRDGEDGRLAAPGDPSAVARAIAGLLSDPGEAARLGAVGRARAVAEFDSSVMAATYDRHYRDVLAGERPSRVP